MKKVIIDRTRWGRGGKGQLADRNRENCCCLSFVANQLCDVPWNDMRGKNMPSDVEGILRKDTDGVLVTLSTYGHGHSISTPFTSSAAETNDADWMDDDEREAELIEQFFDEGIELVFIN